MSVERKTYDREFKIRAVRFYEESDKRLRDVEEELGIGNGCLSHWKKQLAEEKENAFPGQGQLPDSEKELARLRRENEILREERDILKKAVGIFSKKPQ